MSGKTSETRCKWCQQKEYAHSAGICPVAIHMMFEPVAEPTPPEVEAVPEQVKLAQNLSFLEAAPEEVARMNAAIADKYMLYAAPVVSTAAPEPPDEVDFSIDSDQRCRAKKQGTEAIQHDGLRCSRIRNHSGLCRFEGIPVDDPEPAVAPESYKPAEGPDDSLPPHIQYNLSQIKRISDAATPVTVEAPSFEAWWNEVNPVNHQIPYYSRDEKKYWAKLAWTTAATPKPIGDVEAVARKIYEASPVINGEVRPSFDEIVGILIPFFAPAGPENKENMEIDLNDPRYCGACKHIHPLGEVACRCYCDRVDCLECSKRIAARVMAPELAREIDKYYQVFEETPEDQRIAAVSEIILGRRFEELKQVPAQPPCSECATLQEKLEIAQRYGQREYAIEQILRGDLSTAEAECATLRKERDGLRDENYMLRHAPKGCSFCGEIQGHTAECWTVKTVDRLSAAEAQLSTLRDALEREKLAAELFGRHRTRNNGRVRNEAAQLPMWQLMSAYERQNWLDTAADVQNIISAALAPTPEVATKE